ncbi:MAG: hypothetical protein JF886_05335 [Candidatus Dormibacteraeota bacterium]|uniref:Uncharacterized protein n=1 Tax=Candidatus Aeolococcus gillhamiae TaxID=3127015 RepID=A0A934K2A1_9BACT|nr:hypothetical protein [Candidatus Dormibacteraeota bacterium]
MAELPRFPNPDEDAVGERASTTGRPRWVAVVGIGVAVGLVVLVVVLHLTGVIGPGSH